LDLGQLWRAKDIWKEMQRYSVISDFWCFDLLVQVCGENGDSFLAKELFWKIKNGVYHFREINVVHCAQLIQALSCGSKMEDTITVLKWMEDYGTNQMQYYICISLNHARIW
jgi:hypothetical protein